MGDGFYRFLSPPSRVSRLCGNPPSDLERLNTPDFVGVAFEAHDGLAHAAVVVADQTFAGGGEEDHFAVVELAEILK